MAGVETEINCVKQVKHNKTTLSWINCDYTKLKNRVQKSTTSSISEPPETIMILNLNMSAE